MAEGESSPGDSEVVNIGQEKAKHPSIRTWYRVVFAGDPGVGKTSLYLRYTTGEYVESPPNIIGDANGAIKVVKLKGTSVGLEIWDTGGQERYHSITDNYYRSANVVLFCYDVTDKGSFSDIGKWVQDVVNRLRDPGAVKMILVATKSDLYKETKEEECVSSEEGKKKAATMKPPVFFIETSAKDAINVNELFEQVAKEVSAVDDSPQETIMIDKGNGHRSGSGGGCCKKT